jgi:hypothetical protein
LAGKTPTATRKQEEALQAAILAALRVRNGKAVVDDHVGGLHVAAEISAVHLSNLALTADNTALHFLSHRFAKLVLEDKGALVGDAQVAAEGQRGLALHLVAEYGNGRQTALEGQLVAGEQRAGRDGEILFAASAAEAQCAIRAAGFVGIDQKPFELRALEAELNSILTDI